MWNQTHWGNNTDQRWLCNNTEEACSSSDWLNCGRGKNIKSPTLRRWLFFSGLPSLDVSRESGWWVQVKRFISLSFNFVQVEKDHLVNCSYCKLCDTHLITKMNTRGVYDSFFAARMKKLPVFVVLLLLRACSAATYRWVKTFSSDIRRSFHLWSGVESLSSPCLLTENVALRGKASQVTRYDHPFGDAYSAIDGNNLGNFRHGSCTHTAEQEEPWWTVDLLHSYVITSITITNRQDCCQARLSGVRIHIGNSRNNNGLRNPMWVKYFAIKWRL